MEEKQYTVSDLSEVRNEAFSHGVNCGGQIMKEKALSLFIIGLSLFSVFHGAYHLIKQLKLWKNSSIG